MIEEISCFGNYVLIWTDTLQKKSLTLDYKLHHQIDKLSERKLTRFSTPMNYQIKQINQMNYEKEN